MLDFIVRRLIAIVPVLTVVAVLVFLMLRLTPGDPAAVIAGDNATSDQIADIRAKLGLNEPIWTQFAIWIGSILQGNFGESYFFKKTVAELIAQRIEPTLALALCTLIFAVCVSVPIGVMAASAPPVSMTSASPRTIARKPSPMAMVPEAQLIPFVLFGPDTPKAMATLQLAAPAKTMSASPGSPPCRRSAKA